MVLIRTLSVRKAREIPASIDRQLELLERGIHAGLAGYALTEGRSREGRVKRINEEEDNHLAHRFHSTLLSRNLRKAVSWTTNREVGGWCLFPGDV